VNDVLERAHRRASADVRTVRLKQIGNSSSKRDGESIVSK
jgi:hypothetical protein